MTGPLAVLVGSMGAGKTTVGGLLADALGVAFLDTDHLVEGVAGKPVSEIFVDDSVMRKRMADVLKKHMQVDDELDEEVRRRIKNLQEGTSTWEVEYGKVLDQIKRNRGLDQ